MVESITFWSGDDKKKIVHILSLSCLSFEVLICAFREGEEKNINLRSNNWQYGVGSPKFEN